jgi:hypothetical protein
MPSSVIQIMFYDPHASVLDIVYRLGRGTYRYFNVSHGEWQAFRASPSKGTHLNEVFKDQHPRYAKMAKGEGMSRNTPGVEFWPRASE